MVSMCVTVVLVLFIILWPLNSPINGVWYIDIDLYYENSFFVLNYKNSILESVYMSME